jgi:hypothetical protein
VSASVGRLPLLGVEEAIRRRCVGGGGWVALADGTHNPEN